MTVVANCLRCGDQFTATDQDAMSVVFGTHQAARHSDLAPAFSFSQPEDPAATEAGRQAAAAQAVLDGNAATMADRAAAAIGNLEQAAQNWGTLTAAQKDQAMKLTVQVVARLARLVLRRLDTAT
jgi:hypothetical protein